MIIKIFFILLILANLDNSIWSSEYENYIRQGDFYFKNRNNITISVKAIENINRVIELYNKAIDLKEDEVIFYKLTKAMDFKYNYLLTDEKYYQEKRDNYKFLIERINKFCEKNNCNESKYILYSWAILTGRFGELMNIMEAAADGTAGKIKDYAEKLIKIDNSFENHAAYIILGRLHFKAPNIVFLLTWPDKKKAKEYLEKYLEKEPDSLTGIYFLADILWESGEKVKAKELYEKVLKTKPRKDFYYEDIKAQAEVKNKKIIDF